MKCIVSESGWYSGNALDLYLGGAWVEVWPGHGLSLLGSLGVGGYSSVPLGAGIVPL